ncbi:MAG: hypothetical protein HY352_05680 [Candidatus Omnitrophica bacterium]|nr:hypothetical protein [Candidatus Omnitrophota bacterium]
MLLHLIATTKSKVYQISDKMDAGEEQGAALGIRIIASVRANPKEFVGQIDHKCCVRFVRFPVEIQRGLKRAIQTAVTEHDAHEFRQGRRRLRLFDDFGNHESIRYSVGQPKHAPLRDGSETSPPTPFRCTGITVQAASAQAAQPGRFTHVAELWHLPNLPIECQLGMRDEPLQGFVFHPGLPPHPIGERARVHLTQLSQMALGCSNLLPHTL